MSIQVRPVVGRAELEAAYDLWATVFDEGRAFFQERIDYDPAYRPETTFVAMVDGELAGAIQIFPYQAYWGTVRVQVGGVGNVATLPQFRHRGIAQLILRQQIGWMEEMGFDFAHLFTGIPAFYAQMGWRAFPDGEGYRVVEGPPGSPPAGLRIRTGDFDQDRSLLAELYAAASPAVHLAWVRSPGYWAGLARWQARQNPALWIAEQDGRPIGYAIGGRGRDQRPRLRELIVRPGFEGAARPLWDVFRESLGVDEGLVLSLPPGHPLLEGASPSPVASGAMWRRFDPARLLRRLTPELERRWQTTGGGPDSALAIGVGEDPVFVLRAHDDRVEVLAPSAAPLTVDEARVISPDDFTRLVITGAAGRSLDHPLLRRLFPETVPFLWEADHF